MKIFYFSDAHDDINRHNISSNIEEYIPDNCDLYLDAGDTSGTIEDLLRFYSNPFWEGKRVLFVGGNHLTYCGMPLDKAHNMLKEKFHLHNNITFLENDYVKIDNTIFLGATLWTDYEAYNRKLYDMRYAYNRIRDYKYVYFTDDVRLTPEITVKLHKQTMNYFESRLSKFKKHNVVILTHHAPSKLSTSIEYQNDSLNPAFYSNLDSMINKYDNLKLWVHGHIHSSSNYMINNCSVLSNPIGYQIYEDTYITGFSKRKIINFHTMEKVK